MFIGKVIIMQDNELLARLDPSQKDGVSSALAQIRAQQLPTIINVLVVFGAFLSCGLFLFLTNNLFPHPLLLWAIVWGYVSLACWYGLKRAVGARAAFLRQLGIASQLLSAGLGVAGVSGLFHWSLGAAALASAVLATARTFFEETRTPLRCLSGALVMWWLVAEQPLSTQQWPWAALLLWATALAMFYSRRVDWRSWGYALLLMSAAALGVFGVKANTLSVPWGSVAVAAFLLAFYMYRKKTVTASDALWFVLGLAAAYVTNLGLVMGVGLAALGAILYNWKLRYMGLAAVCAALYLFYYQMDVTLLVKSAYLALGGAALLLTRAAGLGGKHAK